MRKNFTLFCICLALIPAISFSQVNLSNGLSAYYPFNSSFMDMSGNNNNGTAYGGVGFGTDHVGNGNAAAYFDGIDDWVSITSAANLTPSTAMTLAFRYKAMDDFGQQVMISKGNFTGSTTIDNIQFQVGVYSSQFISSDNLFFSTEQDGSCATTNSIQSDYLFNTSPTDTNQWYCVVMTFAAGQKRMYVNGNLTAVQSSSSSAIDSCDGGVFKFGTWWQNHLLHYKGYLDEVRFYKRTLNTQEIDSVCNLHSPGTTELAYEISLPVVEISPNPASDKIKIDVPSDWNTFSISLYNQLGQKVYNGEHKEKPVRLETNDFPDGIYFIALSTAGRTFTYKLVKQ